MVHEFTHKYAGTGHGWWFGTASCYNGCDNAGCPSTLSASEALDNAYSYAGFARGGGAGRVRLDPPTRPPARAGGAARAPPPPPPRPPGPGASRREAPGVARRHGEATDFRRLESSSR